MRWHPRRSIDVSLEEHEGSRRSHGCSKSFLDTLRVKGGGPTFIKVGRHVRYDDGDLDSWIASRKARLNQR
jgi:hypothetical protein